MGAADGGPSSRYRAFSGMVNASLEGEGKPELVETGTGCRHASNASRFREWYRDVPGTNAVAVASPPYSDAHIAEPDETPHNFHFTSEIRIWFQYRADSGQSIAFTGDDDLWVFIDGQLVVDLGGIHLPVSDSADLDPEAASLGLVDGGIYELAVFHAERQTTGSSFRLTLNGTDATPSECVRQ